MKLMAHFGDQVLFSSDLLVVISKRILIGEYYV